MKKNVILMLVLITSLLFSGCSKDETEVKADRTIKYTISSNIPSTDISLTSEYSLENGLVSATSISLPWTKVTVISPDVNHIELKISGTGPNNTEEITLTIHVNNVEVKKGIFHINNIGKINGGISYDF